MNFHKKIYHQIKDLIKKQYAFSDLMIVSKNRPVTSIREALNEGAFLFGENKVQEAGIKFEELRPEYSNIDLHLIGPLQTNKVKQAMKIFDTIQTVDREKLVKEISKNKSDTVRTKNFYIQINIGSEEQKSGIDPEKSRDFYNFSVNQGLNVVGLMCIPPNNENADIYFKQMFDLRNTINPKLLLSMGMSGDYLTALKNQTNLIRIGSKLFDE